jgi:predicted deacetylase
MSWLVVSVHDVAPATEFASRWWVRELEQRGVRATLLVIPGLYRGQRLEPGSPLAGWLRDSAAAGHEIAQHGWEHRGVTPVRGLRSAAVRVASRGCAEFACLGVDDARRRIRSGLEVLESCDLAPQGFAPPAGLASDATIRILQAIGFRYVATTLSVIDLANRRRIDCLSRCHRPGAIGEWLGRRVVRAAAGAAAAGRSVRIALHPADLEHRGLRRDALVTIEEILARGVRPTTYGELCAPTVGCTLVTAGT